MKEKAWLFRLDLIGYGGDPEEAWSNLLLYALKSPPPCERLPEKDVDLEDEGPETLEEQENDQ